MSFDFIVTDAGRAALVNAQNTGTAPVTIAQVGISPTAIVADPTTAALAGEIKRIGGVPGLVVADDTIHINVSDHSGDAYAARSLALYLADGTLFAAYGQVAPILEKTAASIGLLAIDIIFADINAALITFGDAEFTNPPASTEVQGVVELATQGEADAGIDTTRALTPARAKAAVLSWLLSQDGSGSGLDADMLDGQNGAWYADIAARLGFTPLDAVLFTASQILSRLVTVDGSGSGLDADMLDGQEGSYYANIAARLGYTPVNKAGDVMLGLLTLFGAPTIDLHAATKKYVDDLSAAAAVLGRLLTVDGSGSGLDADLLDGQHGSYYTNIIARLGYTPLNSGLFVGAEILSRLVTADGSGSGLDADVWRGKSPTQFIADMFQTGTGPSGRWWKMPDGNGGTVIEQIGSYGGISAQGMVAIAFPTAFTDTDYDLQLTAIIPGAGDYDNFVQEIAGTRTVNGVSIYAQDPSSGGSSNLAGFRWRAKGY
jgi:hypothetical protein